MEYRTLGKTGLQVSALGFGGIPIQRVTEQEAIEIVHRALDKGINFFDSARGYTDSEEKLGKGLKGKRGNVILATKTMARDEKTMARDIETSLKNFQTDHIHLYQCHNVKTEADLEKIIGPHGALEALVKAQEAGKIGYIGITGHNDGILIKALEMYDFSTLQFPRNFLEDTAEKELFPLARKKEMGIIIMKPLAGGAFKRADLALRYLLGLNYSTVIPGMDTIEQVEHNSSLTVNIQPLSSTEREELLREAKILGNQFCRRCEYCKPCPQGLDIPTFFILHSYFQRYGLGDWSKERYGSIQPNVESCMDCGICETRCPYQLPIREMLKQVHGDLGR
ncbi:MAG: uncharacterized protein PWQ67_349 [Clostridia bacterium]|jgi:hypothetical protein|nr:uncharacterized protein [Clostridia bacterium]MDN5321895.1 uncharacterized protein [Clostridia bacterium]